VWVLREIPQGDLGLALSDHEMYNDQAFKDNGPCGISQSVREGAEDLRNAGFTGVRRDQNVLDIFRFGGGKLQALVRGLLQGVPLAMGRVQGP
jgi:hypothetical protein